MTWKRILALTLVATLTPASAQGVTAWGGLGTEAYLVPTATLGLSADLGQFSDVKVGVRGTAGLALWFDSSAPGPLTLLGADVLFSGATGPLNVYGGPGVAFVPGGGVLMVGAVGGLKGQFGAGSLGWFAEGKLRYAFAAGQGTGLVLPGANLGITYRF